MGKAQKIYKKLKSNLSAGDLKKMLFMNVIGQGIGAGVGYGVSTDYTKKKSK